MVKIKSNIIFFISIIIFVQFSCKVYSQKINFGFSITPYSYQKLNFTNPVSVKENIATFNPNSPLTPQNDTLIFTDASGSDIFYSSTFKSGRIRPGINLLYTTKSNFMFSANASIGLSTITIKSTDYNWHWDTTSNSWSLAHDINFKNDYTNDIQYGFLNTRFSIGKTFLRNKLFHPFLQLGMSTNKYFNPKFAQAGFWNFNNISSSSSVSQSYLMPYTTSFKTTLNLIFEAGINFRNFFTSFIFENSLSNLQNDYNSYDNYFSAKWQIGYFFLTRKIIPKSQQYKRVNNNEKLNKIVKYDFGFCLSNPIFIQFTKERDTSFLIPNVYPELSTLLGINYLFNSYSKVSPENGIVEATTNTELKSSLIPFPGFYFNRYFKNKIFIGTELHAQLIKNTFIKGLHQRYIGNGNVFKDNYFPLTHGFIFLKHLISVGIKSNKGSLRPFCSMAVSMNYTLYQYLEAVPFIKLLNPGLFMRVGVKLDKLAFSLSYERSILPIDNSVMPFYSSFQQLALELKYDIIRR